MKNGRSDHATFCGVCLGIYAVEKLCTLTSICNYALTKAKKGVILLLFPILTREF